MNIEKRVLDGKVFFFLTDARRGVLGVFHSLEDAALAKRYLCGSKLMERELPEARALIAESDREMEERQITMVAGSRVRIENLFECKGE